VSRPSFTPRTPDGGLTGAGAARQKRRSCRALPDRTTIAAQRARCHTCTSLKTGLTADHGPAGRVDAAGPATFDRNRVHRLAVFGEISPVSHPTARSGTSSVAGLISDRRSPHVSPRSRPRRERDPLVRGHDPPVRHRLDGAIHRQTRPNAPSARSRSGQRTSGGAWRTLAGLTGFAIVQSCLNTATKWGTNSPSFVSCSR
jgi:hypothetical protein